MAGEYIVTRIDKANVVEFRCSALMDALVLEEVGAGLNKMVDEEDRRVMILDFAKVEYLSSQAIGIVIALHRKLSALPHSKLFLCGVTPRLMELLRITRLDKVLTIKPTQNEAINAVRLG
jgi:anti-sigma B factor antagonist